MSAGQFIQDDFQKPVSSTTETDPENWTQYNFAEQVHKSKDSEEVEDSSAPDSVDTKSVKNTATKRKQVTVSRSKVKKLKGIPSTGILRTNGK